MSRLRADDYDYSLKFRTPIPVKGGKPIADLRGAAAIVMKRIRKKPPADCPWVCAGELVVKAAQSRNGLVMHLARIAVCEALSADGRLSRRS